MPAEATTRQRQGKNVNVWMPAEVVDAFHSFCREEKRTKSAQLEVILRAVLAGRLAKERRKA